MGINDSKRCYEVATLVVRYYTNDCDIYYRNAAIAKYGNFGRNMFNNCVKMWHNAQDMQAAVNNIYRPLAYPDPNATPDYWN